MSSTREKVLAAAKALVVKALPSAKVDRNRPTPESPNAGGDAILYDGDPGDPEIDLSPLRYNYVHRIPVALLAYAGVADDDREDALDDMLVAIGQAIAADRTLGGLVEWFDAEAPNPDDLALAGAEPGRSCDLILVAQYATPTPLT